MSVLIYSVNINKAFELYSIMYKLTKIISEANNFQSLKERI